MQKIPELSDDHPFASTAPPPKSGKQKAWEVLLRIAPELELIQRRGPNEPRPPDAIGNAFFLQIVACLLDPVKRSIIQAIITDMVDDHVKEQIRAYITEDEQWASSVNSTNPRE
jgi:hypothetical protein